MSSPFSSTVRTDGRPRASAVANAMAFGSSIPAATASSIHRRSRTSGSSAAPSPVRPRAVYSCRIAARSGDSMALTVVAHLGAGRRRSTRQNDAMTDGPNVDAVVHHGLEGVVAFESEIAEPDKEGSALRYRGVDIDDLVGRVPFGRVWGLLVDGAYEPGPAPAERVPL